MCRSGSPVRESRWSNAGGEEAAGLDLGLAAVADAGEGRLAFQPGEGVGDGLVVGRLDLLADRSGTERPQQRGALHRGEDQVVAGDRTAVLARLLGLDLRLDGLRRWAPVLGFELLEPCRDAFRAGRELLVRRERAAELRRCSGVRLAAAGCLLEGDDLLGVGVHALAEQRPHLVLADPSLDGQVLRHRNPSSGRAGCRRRCSSRPASARQCGPRRRRRPAGSGRCTRRRRGACAASSSGGSAEPGSRFGEQPVGAADHRSPRDRQAPSPRAHGAPGAAAARGRRPPRAAPAPSRRDRGRRGSLGRSSHHGPASATRIGLRVFGSAATRSSASAARSAGQPRPRTASCSAAARHGPAHRVTGEPSSRRTCCTSATKAVQSSIAALEPPCRSRAAPVRRPARTPWRTVALRRGRRGRGSYR